MEKKVVFLFFLLSFSSAYAQHFYVKVLSETANVYKGKKVTIIQDIYYQTEGNKLLSHFIKPEEYIYSTNLKGEARFYYPATNKVKLMHDMFLSSKNNLLYYFVNNQLGDMGLREAGFQLTSSTTSNNQNISSYKPPLDMVQQILKVELVHENFLPKFMAYYSPKGDVVKKIYYANYQQYQNFILPLRVVEIEYKSPNDSIIHNQVFKNVEVSTSAFDAYFDYIIPANAKMEEN